MPKLFISNGTPLQIKYQWEREGCNDLHFLLHSEIFASFQVDDRNLRSRYGEYQEKWLRNILTTIYLLCMNHVYTWTLHLTFWWIKPPASNAPIYFHRKCIFLIPVQCSSNISSALADKYSHMHPAKAKTEHPCQLIRHNHLLFPLDSHISSHRNTSLTPPPHQPPPRVPARGNY